MARTSGRSFLASTRDIISSGIILAGVLFLVEVLIAGRGNLSILGTPLVVALSVYLAVGAGIGLVAGLAAGLMARAAHVSARRLALPPLVWVFASMFVMRSVTAGEVRHFPPLLIGVLVVGAVTTVVAWLWARGTPAAAGSGGAIANLPLVVLLLVMAAPAAWMLTVHDRLPVRKNARADAPNIIFILVDALRQDRVSAFGYDRPTTPNVKRLAADGVRFDNAYAQGNRTAISMPALFTSMYPSMTGVFAFQDKMSPLPKDRVTIADLCRSSGYSTFAMMSNPYLKRPFGLTHGFDRVEEFDPGRYALSAYRVLVALHILSRPEYVRTKPSATEVTDAAMKWLARAPKSSPFFCYVHYMDVHHPYLPPPQYEKMFRSRESLASIDPQALFMKTVELVHDRKPYPLDSDDLARLSDLYDADIRYVDTEIGRLIAVAKNAPNGRPTVIVFTADHGDEFQEHGCIYHNNVVIQQLIRIPLVIWRSDHHFGEDVTQMVRHVDVLPTLAEWAGAKIPLEAIGRSLLPLMDGKSLPPVSSIAEGDYCSALVEPGWKVMHVDTTNTDTLFDLTTDPWGSTDVAAEHPRRWQAMRDSLDVYLRAVAGLGERRSTTVNKGTLKQLKALGYVN